MIPGAPWASWGRPREILGLTRESLDALGGPWGVPGGSLAGPWGPLGAPPGLRGPSKNNGGSPVGRQGSRERGPRVPGGIKGVTNRSNKQVPNKDLTRRWAKGPANIWQRPINARQGSHDNGSPLAF